MEIKVYSEFGESAGQLIQTMQVYNAEYFLGIIVGCLVGLTFWVSVREMI